MEIQPVVFVSATYIKDLPRFKLLRKSMDRFAPDIMHRVAVHAEDASIFRREFQANDKIEFVPTNLLLPERLERARLGNKRWAQTKFIRQMVRSTFPFGHFNGYHAQQLTKFELARTAKADYAIVIDSDVIVSRPATALALHTLLDRGKQILCFSVPCDKDMHERWQRNAFAANKIGELSPDTSGTDGIVMPCAISPKAINAMASHIEKVHGLPWQMAIAKNFKSFSEFLIYEKFCRYVLPPDRVALEPPSIDWVTTYWKRPNDHELIESFKVNPIESKYFFHLQSNFSDYDYSKAFEMMEGFIDRAPS